MIEAVRSSPLDSRVFGGNGVSLSPLPACERISLRADKESLATLGKAIGLTIPTKPSEIAENDGIAVLWIGPDEWFVTAPSGSDMENKLNSVEAGNFSAVSIDHRNTGLIISGTNAILALNSGCPRDLSLEAFPVDTCSRTILAKAEIILWRMGETEFRIECWRSFSDYVWKYLVDAASRA